MRSAATLFAYRDKVRELQEKRSLVCQADKVVLCEGRFQDGRVYGWTHISGPPPVLAANGITVTGHKDPGVGLLFHMEAVGQMVQDSIVWLWSTDRGGAIVSEIFLYKGEWPNNVVPNKG
jgi:hypothetical protein